MANNVAFLLTKLFDKRAVLKKYLRKSQMFLNTQPRAYLQYIEGKVYKVQQFSYFSKSAIYLYKKLTNDKYTIYIYICMYIQYIYTYTYTYVLYICIYMYIYCIYIYGRLHRCHQTFFDIGKLRTSTELGECEKISSLYNLLKG
jgi:hypothetical protein